MEGPFEGSPPLHILYQVALAAIFEGTRARGLLRLPWPFPPQEYIHVRLLERVEPRGDASLPLPYVQDLSLFLLQLLTFRQPEIERSHRTYRHV